MKFANRVSLFLDDQHVPFETFVCPPAYTAQNLAKRLHISGRQVAKSVILAAPGGFYVAILPANCRIDLQAISAVIGVPIRLASDDEMAELFNDCERGSVAPFGTLYGLSTLLDDSFAPNCQLVFEAQQHSLAIRMRCRDFERVENPRRFRFALDVEKKNVE